MVVLSAAVSQFGETVQVDALAFRALENLEQTALAHGGVEFCHRHGGLHGTQRIALLVVVKNQFVCGQTPGNQMIGDELVQHVVLILVVVVLLCVGIYTLCNDIFLDIFNGDLVVWLTDNTFPEFVRFGKQCIAVLTVFGQVTGLTH